MAESPFLHARLAALFLVLLTTSVSARVASAQVATGSFVGTITDSSGQLVPGAQVTLREVNRNTTTTLVSDSSGVYTAPFLVPGTYEVQVELQGFKTWIRRGIVLQVNDRVRVDASLEVGTVSESTTVVASTPSCEPIPRRLEPLSRRRPSRSCRSTAGTSPHSCTWLQASRRDRRERTFPARARSILAAPPTSTRSGPKRTPMPGSLTALTQRVHVQHLSSHAVGRADPRVQGADRRVFRGVRPWCRCGIGLDEVGSQSAPWDGVRIPAQRRLRRAQFLCPQDHADGRNAVKDPVPPLDRHQFGAALGGALVHPGALRRPQPHILLRRLLGHQGASRRHDGQYRSDRCDAHRRLQRLSRPQRQPDPDLRSVDHSSRRTGTRHPGSVPEQRHPVQSDQSCRSEHRQRVSTAEYRNRQLRQLHLDPRPRDQRQRVLGAGRSPAFRQGLVLRTVQLRQIPSRRPPGSGELLPPDACRSGRAIRPRPLRRRHPEHEADDAWCGIQLLEGHEAAARQRTARRLREYGAVHDAVRLRPSVRRIARHSRHQHQPDHDGPAEHRHHELHRALRRPGVPARQSQPVALPDRRRARLAQRSAPAEGRVSPRRSVPLAVHPRQHAKRDQLQHELRQQPAHEYRRYWPGRGARRVFQQRGAGDSCWSHRRFMSWSRRRSCRTTSR